MFRTAFVILAAIACAKARPQQHPFGNFGFQFPAPAATGQSSATLTQGETKTPLGTSLVTSQQAGSGGTASFGGTNFGNAFSTNQQSAGLLGTASKGDTGATSVQNAGLPSLPGFPQIHIPGFGSATGSASSQFTQGKTTGPDGSQSTITQLASNAGGTAQNGGTSVNKATGSTTSVDTIFGSHTSSNVDSTSSQTGR